MGKVGRHIKKESQTDSDYLEDTMKISGTKSHRRITPINPVAKNMEKYNRPATHKDKKKESKVKGYKIDKAEIDDYDNEL
jgi:hypothetical protein